MQCNGAIAARLDYQPFGEEIASDTELRTAGRGYGSVDSTRQRYAGMERDESGLDHTLWRKYESRAGRWTTPDPYSGSMQTGDPQSFNRYAYVGNDPVNFTDPSGLIISIPSIGPPPSWVDVPISFDSSGVLGAVTGDGRLRPHIWSELEQRGKIPKKPKTPYVDEAVLNECTQDYFGVTLNSFTPSSHGKDGSFTGTGPSYLHDNPNGAGYDDTFTITNNVRRYSTSELSTINRNLTGKDQRVTGMTDPYTPLRNYTANDLKSPLEILKTQVHELAHSLDAITAIQYKDKGVEPGDKLESCVIKRGGFKYR